MEALPITSEWSIKKGLWFVFPAGENTIRAWGSGISGLERIYVNDAVVSERRSLGRSSTHTFMADGQEYAVEFRTISLLKGHMECTLLKDGKAIKGYLAKYSGPKPFSSARRLIIPAICGAVIGPLAAHYKLSLWLVLGLIALVGVVFVVVVFVGHTREKGLVSIEEVTLAGSSPTEDKK